MMKPLRTLGACLMLMIVGACDTAQEEFVADRLHTICDQAFTICARPSGCVLDGDHYVEGVFPGTRRVVVETDSADADVTVRIFFSSMESPGTELLVQLYETDCTLNTDFSRIHLVDVDLFEKAGDDRSLRFDLLAGQKGEHLLEIYSDVGADYVLVADVD